MPKKSKIVGLLLILLGVGSWIATGADHFTALIPAFFGLVFFGLGSAARQKDLQKHAMQAALLNAMFGVFGTFPALVTLFQSLGGDPIGNQAAVYSQSAMAALCLFFLIAGLREYLKPRDYTFQDVQKDETAD